ncbi:MAG TPA: class I SAM-dependent methyltransferase [Candidatus Polarisedimenticolia bacterium]|nr:class I SAM-dependent methyltransferase [Candidatus Polarisedimenticolia bacterium]
MAAKTVRPGVFERYPQLATLRGLVPDELVEREIGSRADEFERTLRRAAAVIPTVRLRDVFPPEIEAGAIHLENFLGHWGNVSIETVCKICLIVRSLRPRRVLEIGTYNGMTTLQMALNAPPGCVVYTLDLPPDREPGIPPSELDRLVARSFRARFGTSTGSYFRGRDDLKIVQLLGDSATFDYGAVIDGPLDLVFIDGAHDYRTKAIDTQNVLRLLAPGGVVVWDNYADVSNPEVTRFLLDQSASLKLSHLRNTMLVVHRHPGRPENSP